jgi:hypothetical protein
VFIKFIQPYQHYSKGQIADVDIALARRLMEIDFAVMVSSSQSVTPKIVRAYEDKVLEYVPIKKKPRGRPVGSKNKRKTAGAS